MPPSPITTSTEYVSFSRFPISSSSFCVGYPDHEAAGRDGFDAVWLWPRSPRVSPRVSPLNWNLGRDGIDILRPVRPRDECTGWSRLRRCSSLRCDTVQRAEADSFVGNG